MRCARLAAALYVGPAMARVACECPEVTSELMTDDSRSDPVGEGFDAGIRIGEFDYPSRRRASPALLALIAALGGN